MHVLGRGIEPPARHLVRGLPVGQPKLVGQVSVAWTHRVEADHLVGQRYRLGGQLVMQTSQLGAVGDAQVIWQGVADLPRQVADRPAGLLLLDGGERGLDHLAR